MKPRNKSKATPENQRNKNLWKRAEEELDFYHGKTLREVYFLKKNGE